MRMSLKESLVGGGWNGSWDRLLDDSLREVRVGDGVPLWEVEG